MYRMRFPPNRYEMCVLRNSICLCDSPELCEQETGKVRGTANPVFPAALFSS